MAESGCVWGIDIGQAGLKAVRLRYAEAAQQSIAVAFDYVPHPKILSQPDAIPEELIPQALAKFLERNNVEGDSIAISVPGQTSLVKFIKLPPVESSKVGEIVKYEARQQIPFALEDVIWDYQPLGGGIEEGGYLLDAEVGLFAMKRDQVLQHLQPFTDARLEVELIQTAPLALFNVLSYDYMGQRPAEDDEDADEVGEHVLLLDMGADNTTLLVSDGQGIWIRNVPIGGNHFTRALTKEMKLTFAKAEHLKCNATKSPDPRAVFQALRPVFNDYVSEIQRSIGYFSSVNRDAKISKVLGMGNGFKLAGLQKFLQQNLQYDVHRVDTFQAVVGDSVLNAPLFQENIMSFGVAYGLAIQGLQQTRIKTTLLPPEIALARKIRRKKPWAVTTAAVLLTSLATSAALSANVLSTVSKDRWGGAEADVEQLQSQIGTFKSDYDAQKQENTTIKDRGQKLLGNLETREYWLEIYKAINEALPRDVGDQKDEVDPSKQNRMKIWRITASREPDLKVWFDKISESNLNSMLDKDKENPPDGKAYVFTLEGIHYHHEKDKPDRQHVQYVKQTLISNLQKWMMQHPDSAPVPIRKLGITHAVLVNSEPLTPFKFDPTRKLNSQRTLPLASNGQTPGSQFGGNGDGLAGAEGGIPGGLPGGIPGGLPGGIPGGDPDGDLAGNDPAGLTEQALDGAGGAPQGFAPSGYPSSGRPGFGGVSGGNNGQLPLDDKTYLEVMQTRFRVQFVWKPKPAAERPDEEPTASTDGAEPMNQ